MSLCTTKYALYINLLWRRGTRIYSGWKEKWIFILVANAPATMCEHLESSLGIIGLCQ